MAEGLVPRDPGLPEHVGDAEPRQPDVVVPPASREPLVTPVGRPQSDRVVNRYRIRFGVVYLALAAVVGAAVGSFVVMLLRDPPAASATWSQWQPEGQEGSYPTQIADYVEKRYRGENGRPLVGVIASRPAVQAGDSAVPVSHVVIQNDLVGGEDDVKVVATDDGIMYQLCGLGDNCSIRDGEPSAERHRLLRRQALELALYSLKYIDSLDSVIALLPPAPPDPSAEGDTPSTALFFEKSDLRSALENPLVTTFRSPTETLGTEIELDPVERLTIDRLTSPRLFRYQFTQAPAGGAIMVLAPIS